MALIGLGLALSQAASAGAIGDSEELTEVGKFGQGAGQLQIPSGLASDPVTGHLYVGEAAGNRVSEFTPWGSFVKAFGWDVAPGAVNEQQEVRVRATSGQFKLKFEGVETVDLAFDATAVQVEAALNALPALGAAAVSVSEVPSGTTTGITPTVYVVAFKGGSVKGTDVPELQGTPALSGGVPTSNLLVRTRVDGHASTTGLEACSSESGCKEGLEGAGAGQLGGVLHQAVDADGNIYVSELRNSRVQKFDSAGRFISAFGNAGPGQLGPDGGRGIALCPAGSTLCPAGAVFVADEERIVRFSLAGAFEAELPVPGVTVEGVAFDPISKDLYATFVEKSGVHKLNSSTGEEINGPWPRPGANAVATDTEGDVFASIVSLIEKDKVKVLESEVLEYDSSGKALTPSGCCRNEELLFLVGLGTNGAGDLQVANYAPGTESFVRIFGPPPTIYEGPPRVPPQISTQFATSVQPDGASVVAEINPHFFSDTRYSVQYGVGKCSEGGCGNETPAPPGALLTTRVTGNPVRSSEVSLEGLSPGTTYHYRFVAQSSGGGPVLGEEASFTTPDPLPLRSCANDVFRGGAAARLPDCRAYEMVSPVDKNNGDILAVGFTNVEQSAEDGERFSYSSYRSFADPQGASYTSQYLAHRVSGVGWANQNLTPALATPSDDINLTVALTNPYKLFSPDLCEGWMVVAAEPSLDPGRDFPNYSNAYRRDLCGGAPDEALIPVRPTTPAKEFFPEAQGASADGTAAILRAQLEPKGLWRAYYAQGGGFDPLCVLPDGTPSPGNCSGGTAGETGEGLVALGRAANVAGAISADGSKVYWTESGAAGADFNAPGKVYLRINPAAAQSSGEECESGLACTVKVSEPVSAVARFLAATPSGERALFEASAGPNAGSLYEFELGQGARFIAGKAGLLGASRDLSHIYFTSREVLSGGEENERGEAAEVGKPNLYLEQEGEKTFIARLSETDVTVDNIPSNTARLPLYHAAKVTPDGGTLAFISTARLTDYDNTDQVSGAADSEIYRYTVGAGGPQCVSCSPGGARPRGRMVRGVLRSNVSLATAASIPMASTDLHIPRALSGDGGRLFFNSYDALVPHDSNGQADVYEWESAAGKSACEEQGAELYVAASGGCLSLISNGESPQDSTFADAGTDGRDVFFITNASLLQRDPGLFDVYDARVGGGVPEPPPPPGDCLGETCKPAPSAPNDPTPASSSYEGPENQKPAKKKHKKKHSKKKHHSKQQKKKQAHKRGAGR